VYVLSPEVVYVELPKLFKCFPLFVNVFCTAMVMDCIQYMWRVVSAGAVILSSKSLHVR